MGALDCVSVPRLKSTESKEAFSAKIGSTETCISEVGRDVESQCSKSNSAGRKHSIWWTLAFDIPLLLVVLIVLGIHELRLVPQYKAGFFCNDPNLSYPFIGDTVSNFFVLLSALCLPFGVLFSCELIFLKSDYSKRSRVYQAIRNSLWLYRCYAYGFFFNVTIMETMKMITGSPRPNFFDICEPDTGKTCQGSEFVPTYKCTSTRFGEWMHSDAHHSFPSGHTSLSVYCAMFLAWYLQRRAFDWHHRSVFLVPTLQLCLAVYAAICSSTRINDHRHHWWDVAVGATLGVICGFYAILVLCKNFTSRKGPGSQLCLSLS